ncbi:MAG: hypothetical protein VYA30_12320 [Myxococcota bacterium]|nr:hypothetical protein [Myxococcota bacterium]
MTDSQPAARPFPVFKFLLSVTVLITVTTYFLSWLSGSSLIYEFNDLNKKATIVDSPVKDDPGEKYVALKYSECPGTIESIHVGKADLDDKAPKALIKIRECLKSLGNNVEIDVSITTRKMRFGGSKSGRINQVGSCVLPLLPTRITIENDARCPWM